MKVGKLRTSFNIEEVVRYFHFRYCFYLYAPTNFSQTSMSVPKTRAKMETVTTQLADTVAPVCLDGLEKTASLVGVSFFSVKIFTIFFREETPVPFLLERRH